MVWILDPVALETINAEAHRKKNKPNVKKLNKDAPKKASIPGGDAGTANKGGGNSACPTEEVGTGQAPLTLKQILNSGLTADQLSRLPPEQIAKLQQQIHDGTFDELVTQMATTGMLLPGNPNTVNCVYGVNTGNAANTGNTMVSMDSAVHVDPLMYYQNPLQQSAAAYPNIPPSYDHNTPYMYQESGSQSYHTPGTQWEVYPPQYLAGHEPYQPQNVQRTNVSQHHVTSFPTPQNHPASGK